MKTRTLHLHVHGSICSFEDPNVHGMLASHEL